MTVTKLLALLEQCDLSADVRLVAPAPPNGFLSFEVGTVDMVNEGDGSVLVFVTPQGEPVAMPEGLTEALGLKFAE
jgi:hypothetical protein